MTRNTLDWNSFWGWVREGGFFDSDRPLPCFQLLLGDASQRHIIDGAHPPQQQQQQQRQGGGVGAAPPLPLPGGGFVEQKRHPCAPPAALAGGGKQTKQTKQPLRNKAMNAQQNAQQHQQQYRHEAWGGDRGQQQQQQQQQPPQTPEASQAVARDHQGEDTTTLPLLTPRSATAAELQAAQERVQELQAQAAQMAADHDDYEAGRSSRRMLPLRTVHGGGGGGGRALVRRSVTGREGVVR
jgi:hypothetical protein